MTLEKMALGITLLRKSQQEHISVRLEDKARKKDQNTM
jgi:hypothetical protein